MKTTVNTARRGFLWKAGAALSAPLAAMAAGADARTHGDRDASHARLARLEDVNEIRDLTRRYVRHTNAGAHTDAARLFSDAARSPSVRAAACPSAGSVRALAVDAIGGEETVEIGSGGVTATASMRCTAEIETPIEPVTPLVEMARAQGGGMLKRSEHGMLEGAYVKRAGIWQIERLDFRSA